MALVLTENILIIWPWKKGWLWAWVDWKTGGLKTEFLYDLENEQMPYPNFEQEQ